MSVKTAPPLHADFLKKADVTPSAADMLFIGMREKLHAAMRMPAAHRWVADWLFIESDNCFHRNLTVPPESFDNALHVNVCNHLTTPKGDILAPPAADTPSEMKGAASAFKLFVPPRSGDMLFVPVGIIDTITVGYAYILKFDMGGRSTELCSRFAFDSSCDDLCMVVNLPASMGQNGIGATMAMGISPFVGKPGEYYVLACPKEEYAFENLPNHVLPVTDGQPAVPPVLEKIPQGPPSVPKATNVPLHAPSNGKDAAQYGSAGDIWDNGADITFESEAVPFVGDKLVVEGELSADELDGASRIFDFDVRKSVQHTAVATRRSWVIADGGGTADGVGIPRKPGKSTTAAGAFSMERLSESLDALEHALSGEVYTFQEATAIANSTTGEPVPASSSITSVRLDSISFETKAALQQRVFQSYYFSTLSVPSDNRSISNSAGSRLSKGRQRGAYNNIVVVPRPSSTSGSAGLQLSKEHEKLKQMEIRREERRRRNRLSAARSYERKKKAKRQEK